MVIKGEALLRVIMVVMIMVFLVVIVVVVVFVVVIVLQVVIPIMLMILITSFTTNPVITTQILALAIVSVIRNNTHSHFSNLFIFPFLYHSRLYIHEEQSPECGGLKSPSSDSPLALRDVSAKGKVMETKREMKKKRKNENQCNERKTVFVECYI